MSAEEVVDAVTGSNVVLVLTNRENFRDLANGVAGGLLEEGFRGIFFTADRTYREVQEDMEYSGFDTEDLWFIDIVGSNRGISEAPEDVELTNSPTAYNSINIALTDLFDEIEGEERFVLLDSFTSFLLYGDLKTVGNFVKRATDKARENDAAFIIMAIGDQIDEETVEKLMSFCDTKIDCSDEG
ncbi:MAG: hypothetical protein SVU32_07950 [Candidatus Nanohaloarchaea archaeon]|nr:hypothetical protein [Candidatus Nanohaloarchaea archaeon]